MIHADTLPNTFHARQVVSCGGKSDRVQVAPVVARRVDTALARMANAVGLASNTIAARLGLKESSVSRWMTGDRIVTAARLPALARLLKQPQRAVWEASKASLHAKAKRPPYDPVFTDATS